MKCAQISIWAPIRNPKTDLTPAPKLEGKYMLVPQGVCEHQFTHFVLPACASAVDIPGSQMQICQSGCI